MCPLMPVDQGPPCPCSLALQAPGMAYTHYASCFNTDSHASPWKPASADTALGTVTPAVPQQQPQCALRVPETQDARSWKCAFLQSPVPGPWAGKPCLRDRRQRGKDTSIPSVWGQETEGEARPLKQACLCTRSPGPRGTGKDGLSLWQSGYHWCSLCLPAGRDTRLCPSACDHCSRNHGDCPIKSPLCRSDLPSCLSLPCLLHLPNFQG